MSANRSRFLPPLVLMSLVIKKSPKLRISGKSKTLLFLMVSVECVQNSIRLIWNIKMAGLLLIMYVFVTEMSLL